MKSLMQEDLTVSYLSGRGGVLEKHHVMNGNQRKKADLWGLWIMVTPEEHRWLHDTKEGTAKRLELKAEAQKAFEATGRPRQFWMNQFHKNYLEEE